MQNETKKGKYNEMDYKNDIKQTAGYPELSHFARAEEPSFRVTSLAFT